LRFAGKSPVVPKNLDESLRLYPQIVLDYDRLGDEQLSTFTQLDIRVDKKWNFARLSLDVFFEVENATAQAAPSPTEYALARNAAGIPLDPRSLSIVEADAGTPIPTIGIVIDF
jgi:hypothetical protein